MYIYFSQDYFRDGQAIEYSFNGEIIEHKKLSIKKTKT